MHAKPSEQWNIMGVAVAVIAVVALTFFVDIETIQNLIKEGGAWTPILVILLKASTVVIAPLSGAPLYPLVGAFVGFWPGILYVILGDALGFTIAFFISRYFGYPVVRKIIAHNEHGMLSKIVKHVGTMKGFLQMCLTCFALPELISYGTGLSKLPYWKFILVMVPFSALMSSVLVLFGASLGASKTSVLISFALPFAAGIVIFIGGWLFLRAVRKTHPEEA
jgi:uncharacterized membrane protein YdjX (TVP38/TMEM64 family)